MKYDFRIFTCIFIGITALSLVACANNVANETTSRKAQSSPVNTFEKFRPDYHFTPAKNWMNDPNGMVYYNGEYHLFYQYHPHSTVWGPMHWGHAISEDLLHWQELPIALAPDEHGTIFSGSIVVDHNNTSGLGSKANPAMVALFTYNNEQRKKAGKQDFQTQGLAFSLDKGRTWTKYQHNPIMPNPGIVDFRDPKVSWFAQQQKWVMVVTQGDHIGFYSSKNLLDWKFESTFGKEFGEHGGVWECPDLVRIKVAGTQEYRYVLLVSIVPGAPNGGSGTQYFVGDFNGEKFELDPQFADQLEQKHAVWLDYGTDNYAGVTFANIPQEDGRTVFIGWMNNWLYAQQVPTSTWRSAMTLPRELTLHRTQTGLQVFSQAIQEIGEAHSVSQQKDNIEIVGKTRLSSLFGTLPSSHKLHLAFNAQESTEVQLNYLNETNQKTAILINLEQGTLTIDRTESGVVDFHEKFSGTQVGPFNNDVTVYSVEIFYDKASLEVFINEGELVMSAQVFPEQPYDEVEINTDTSTDAPFTLTSVSMTSLKQ